MLRQGISQRFVEDEDVDELEDEVDDDVAEDADRNP
jgi:hypothetical protein